MKLLEHFKELTTHPKNAQELKGLILQLAIEGKLTKKWREENPDVEDAGLLLKKILSAKNRNQKKLSFLSNITQIKKPFEIPSNWNWALMSDITYLITDGTHHTPNYIESGVPFISVKNLSKGGIDFSDSKYISEEEHQQLIRRCNPEFEDVLLTKIGTTGIAKVIDVKMDFSIFVSVALLKIVKEYLHSYYIELCINSPFIKRQSSDGTEGVGNKNLVLRKIKEFLIPIPPLEEQKAIVAVVEELFKEIEELELKTKERIRLKEDYVSSALQQLANGDTEAEWLKIQKHFKTFFTEKSAVKKLRETILQLAVQGKLTKHWRSENPNQEHAKVLLEKIKAEKAQLIKDKKIKPEKPLPAINKDEIPYDLPEGWVWCRLGEITQKLGAGSTPLGGKNAYLDEGIMFFRSQNIHNYFLKLKDVAFISSKTHEKMNGTKVQSEDLLLNITGGSIGRCALVPVDFTSANVSQHVAIVRLVEKRIKEYIHFLMLSPAFQKNIMDVQVGVSREGLSMTKLKLFLVPFPPILESYEIINKINFLMHFCDELEKEIKQNTEQVEALMKSCLREVLEF
jgi:type I restriction enzyme, S subunit